MPLSSMTGFARAEGEADGLHWAWELKSLNGRGLDIRSRLPAGYDALEPRIRSLISARLTRGQINTNLQINSRPGEAAIQINEDLAERLLAAGERMANRYTISPPRLDGLLALPGILMIDTNPTPGLHGEAILASFEQALAALVQARETEGAGLESVAGRILAELTALVDRAAGHAASQPAAIKAKLQAQIDALLDETVAEDRLAQEVALLAAKADIREELDRLRGHLDAAKALLGSDKAVGRSFDFLCQEFNREANTVCSKASDQGLIEIGLAMKTAIDQLREQIQNVE